MLYHGDRMACRLFLYRATGDCAHAAEARRMLDELRANAPEEYHESMMTNVPIHREILRTDAFRQGRIDTAFLESQFGGGSGGA